MDRRSLRLAVYGLALALGLAGLARPAGAAAAQSVGALRQEVLPAPRARARDALAEVGMLIAARDRAEAATTRLVGVVADGRTADLARGRRSRRMMLDAMTARARHLDVVDAKKQLDVSRREGVDEVVSLKPLRGLAASLALPGCQGYRGFRVFRPPS